MQAVLINAIPVGQIIGRLRETLKELQRHQQDLESLVDQRTHELRTPLSAILGFSSLLIESDLTAKQREQIATISHSGEHLLGLINDVLDVAKIEAGKQEPAMAASDLIASVRTVVEMIRVRAEDNHLSLVYDQAPEVPRYVRVDAPKLRQVLINLLGNAIKFTKEGAVILRLSAKPANEPGRVQLRFDVQDSGVGIPQQDLDRIFEPFEQVRKPGEPTGTGLGLTITRRFVEMMGGLCAWRARPAGVRVSASYCPWNWCASWRLTAKDWPKNNPLFSNRVSRSAAF